jgi:hypothetical protein
MKHTLLAALIATTLFSAVPATAFEIERPGASSGMHENVSIFRINDATYTVTDIPNVADAFETFETPPTDYLEGTKGLTLGATITQDEAIKVIEEYYRENAFDFASIKIRKLTLGPLQFAAWCSARLFVCTNREFRSGNWVEFEVNGANRSGGMTGFKRQVFMIRKIPGEAAQPHPAI